MTAPIDRPQTRNWSDFLAILTGVTLLGIAIWPGEPSATVDADRETTVTPALWLVHIAAGALALVAVGVAQKWRNRAVARILLIVAALLLLGALMLFRDFTMRAMLTSILPAVALLISSFAIGPLPRET